VTGFSDSARTALLAYRWPGNVRELQNTVERAVILSENGRSVTAAALGLPGNLNIAEPSAEQWSSAASEGARDPNLPAEVPISSVASEPTTSVTDAQGQVLRLDHLEKNAIRAALRQTGGNRTQAAAELGISIRTLRNKLQEYRLAGDPIDADLASIDG
jgi:DNA-binding NtrC family response regulator